MRPKSNKEIELMREGGRHLAEILQQLAGQVVVGASGIDIDELAHKEIKARGLQPVLKGYQGYPKTICISLNEAVVHGIPNAEPFVEGDVVKLDLALGNRGMVVDSAITVVATDKPIESDVRRLLDGTQQSLSAGIAAIRGDGTRIGDIAAAIQDVLNQHKLGVVRDLVGHGVGYDVHEEPNVPNYGSKGSGAKLSAGVTIAIEPMATLGSWQVGMLDDGWTVVTRDGSLAAHFEHTVLITDDGAEILTLA